MSKEEYESEVKEYADLISANGFGTVVDSVKFLIYVDKEYRTPEYANEIKLKISENYANSIMAVWYVSNDGLRTINSDYITNKDGVLTIRVNKDEKGTFLGGIKEGTPLVIVDTGKQVKSYTLPIVMIIVTVVLVAGIAVYMVVRKKMSSDETEEDDYE